jgi:hypothetical protein
VRIVDEKLDIALRRTDAAVEVRYVMKNLAERPVTVRFGFPVEANFVADDEASLSPEDYDFDPENRQHRARKLSQAIQQLKGYTVTAGGQTVPATLVVEPFATGKIKPFPGSEALKDIVGWMVSEVTFPADEPLVLELRYAADYVGDYSTTSNDSSASDRSFLYRLSTGAVWNGPIERGTVTIRADGIAADEVAIRAPKERFKRVADTWTWTFKNLEPTLADDIRIDAIPGYSTIWADHNNDWQNDQGGGSWFYIERRKVWGLAHQRFTAIASSTLPATKSMSYDAANLRRFSSEEPRGTPASAQKHGPWAEGVAGDGIGEWVELSPATPSPLLAIEISLGHPKDFTQYGRPSRVEILLNGEHRFVAGFDDRPASGLIPILGYAKKVSKVRITILDVYLGTRYHDTCISRVMLYDRLAKNPNVRGAR